MIAIRKYGWSALVLAALAGCGSEPTTTPPTTETPTTSATETTPPPTTPGEMKAAPGKETPASEGPAPAIEAPQPTPATKDEEKKAAAVSLSAEEVAEIKSLPGGEAQQALKQLVCPVSDEHLGSMGKPLKVTAEGQTFFLCCDGCEKTVKRDPAAVVAKLKK